MEGNDASFGRLAVFSVAKRVVPVVLWFDLDGSLFMGGPSPTVLLAMRGLFSNHRAGSARAIDLRRTWRAIGKKKQKKRVLDIASIISCTAAETKSTV